MKKLIVFVFAALALTACTSQGDVATAQFDDERQSDVPCMKHQDQTPGEEYFDEGDWDTVVSLSILRYYTTNGTKPYCDGKAASEADQGWRKLYVRMGADQTNLR
ncbi:membrane lipoprotein lipid attachment site-containing protein [Lentzea sp. NPDC059081]|uniref:membrane lipoprotein lipid attachment site-containing protein n=1 Tax=Lentzea sp. NPDC059081 TaxID=3346719 RepID=UPI00367A7457